MSGCALRYVTQRRRSEAGNRTSGADEVTLRGNRRGRAIVNTRGREMIVVTVALARLAARFAIRVPESSDGLLLWSGCSRHVENFFLHDRAVKIIHAVTERDLSKRQPHANPISGEMFDVVEIDAANGEGAELIKTGGRLDVREDRRLWRA